MSTGKQLLEELRKDEELKRALAEELLPEALRHRELRRAMLIAISREMVTKDDVESLRKEIEGLRKEMATKEDIEALRREMESLRVAAKEDIEKLRAYVDARLEDMSKRADYLNERVSDLYGVVKTSLVAIVVTLASTILTPLLLRLLLGL
jgi:hypothetical protein